MPSISLVFYQEFDESVPVRDWLDDLPVKAAERCVTLLDLLQEFGHELERPYAAYLGEGLYELRIKFFRVNYRIIYFFHDRKAAILCHGLAKEKEVPKRDLAPRPNGWPDSEPTQNVTHSTQGSEHS